MAPEPGRPPGLDGLLSARVKRARIRRARRETEGAASVLDLGSGLCELLTDLDATVRYVGVERDPWMVGRARRLHPERQFLEADLEDPAFAPGETFERVLLIAVWEHLARPVELLPRVRRWTVPGGRLVLTTPHPRAAHLLEAGSRLGLLSRHADEEHERLWSAKDVVAAAEPAGWVLHRAEAFLFGLNQLVVLEARG